MTQISDQDAYIGACAVTGSGDAHQYIGYFAGGSTNRVAIQSRSRFLAPTEDTISYWYGSGGIITLRVDGQRHLHATGAIGHLDSSNLRVTEIWHATDGVSDSQPVYRGNSNITGFSLALTAEDEPQIAYILGAKELHDATLADDGTWITETVPITLTTYEEILVPQLALDPSGRVLIAYELTNSDYNTHDVRLAIRAEDGSWSTQPIEDDASGLIDGLTVMPSGTGRMVYRLGSTVTQRFLCL